jgi:hypothetical protein
LPGHYSTSIPQLQNVKKEANTTLVTWIPGVENNGRVRDGESVVLDVHLMGGGQLWVVEDLVDTSGQVPDTVLHLHRIKQVKKCFSCSIMYISREVKESITIQLLPNYGTRITLCLYYSSHLPIVFYLLICIVKKP